LKKKIDWARKQAAKILNAKEGEIYFTGGGTESNNIALFGHLKGANVNNNIITTKIEHPSVYNVYKHFEDKTDVRYIDSDKRGKILLEDLEKRLIKILF